MESRKRKRGYFSVLQEESAISRATSTPQHSPVKALSCTISSIGVDETRSDLHAFYEDSDKENTNPEATREKTALDNSKSRSLQSAELASDSSQKTEPEDSILEISHESDTEPKITTIKWRGFWNSFKPIHRGSLYYNLMKRPTDIESIVDDLLSAYFEDKQSVIVSILQLFTHICGYQKESLAKVYNFQGDRGSEIVKQLETTLLEPEIKKTGKFLFINYTNFVTTVETVLEIFLNNLITISYRIGVLHDELFGAHIVGFVESMSKSSFRGIRVTGVILACKLLSACGKLFHQLNESHDKSRANNKQVKDLVAKYLDCLHTIYYKNCLLSDKKSFSLRIVCAKEMFHWIRLFPDVFIFKERCLGRLMRLIGDSNAIVRWTAVHTCKKIICLDSIKEQLKQRIDLCLKIVSQRLVDVDFKVASEAVLVFIAALERFPKNVTKDDKLSIFYRMYEKDMTLANTACRFLANYLHIAYEDEINVLITFTKVAFLKEGFPERLPFLIESCVEFIPELRSWNTFIDILSNNQIEFTLRTQLIEVLNETVRFCLNGKCSKTRGTTTEDLSEFKSEHENLANAILPNFENLMIAFQINKSCMKQLLEILTFINYSSCAQDVSDQCFPVILLLLRDLFGATNDVELLTTVVNVLYYFCEENNYDQDGNLLETIQSTVAEALIEDLKHLDRSTDLNFLVGLRHKSLKSSILFAKFNLTRFFKWEDIFQDWDDSVFKIIKYLLVCCKWHLVWGLRQITEETNDINVSPLFYNNVKEFVYYCIDMLKRTTNTSEMCLIYETLTDLYICFDKELTRKRQFSQVIIQITEPTSIQVLFDFVSRYVVTNDSLSLEKRQLYFNRIISVLYVGGLPVECYSKILCYYHSHYVEFGYAMNDVLKQLGKSHPSLPCIVMHTLAETYNKILLKEKVVNFLSHEVKQLKILAQKFSAIKGITKQEVLKLVTMALNFGLREEKNYPFLYCARYILKMLDDSGKSDAYDIFKKLVPNRDRNNDILLMFAAELKTSS